MLISLQRVTRFYGPRLIFRDVSVDVERGTVTLLAGANGAGKSTLLKIMAGLLRPSSGTVTYGNGGSASAIGYLGHQTFLYPDLTALENLRFWAAMHRRKPDEREIESVLKRVELASFAEEKARVFSRGMAQRLNLARVFLLKPGILLLDEPGTGLDSRSTGILHREVAAAKDAGAGIVWITHNLADDLRLADRAVILEGKGIGFYGSAAQCLDRLAGQREEPCPAPAFEARVRAGGGELC